MKRGFLFGLGSFFVVCVLGGLLETLKGNFAITIVMLIAMPLSLVTIRAAKLAPPNRSRLHAISGWLLGFLVIDAVILGGVGIALLFS